MHPLQLYSRGYLPHALGLGHIHMITTRLHDALPPRHSAYWDRLTEAASDAERMRAIQSSLDQGYGSCALGRPDVARIVWDSLFRFQHERYVIHAAVLMPNHAHLVISPMDDRPLWRTIGQWKGYSALEVNRLLGRIGPFWQRDFYDRAIRDEAHFNRACTYVLWNAPKAKLCSTPGDWPWVYPEGLAV
ncbi:MAG: transposase [bacterium]